MVIGLKSVLIKCLEFYQCIPGNFHNYCRFYPTCSEYMKISIDRFGCVKGCFLGFKRLIRCHPFGRSGYDSVPEENIK